MIPSVPSDIDHYYRVHAPVYDTTRWSFLFGRSSLTRYLPELPPGSEVLDLGCGTGKHLNMLGSVYQEATITGLDQSRQMLSIARRKSNSQTLLRNETYTPTTFRKGKFDLILASYSLTMMSDIDEVLRTINADLTPGGFLLVVDFDASPLPWFRNWMKMNHVHFDHDLFPKVKDLFVPQRIHNRNAWLGLYSYSIFLGKKIRTVSQNTD